MEYEVSTNAIADRCKSHMKLSRKHFDEILERLDVANKTIGQLQDLVIWMTGCGYDFCQHEYFTKARDRLLVDINTNASSEVEESEEQAA